MSLMAVLLLWLLRTQMDWMQTWLLQLMLGLHTKRALTKDRLRCS
jgi:hypothetical protein